MIKRFFQVSVLASAVGVPYLLTSSSELWKSASAKFAGTGEAKTATPNPQAVAEFKTGATEHGQGHHSLAQGISKPLPPEGYNANDLADVLRFDSTPDWVLSRWPRVTAGLSELDLQGYRVPLVTGTHDDDLAGSLTYYFDKKQKVAQIGFRGTTGDPRKLITLVTSKYEFVRQETNDPSIQIYQAKWNGKAYSELRIRTARVVRADQPRARYQVELAMKRP